MPDVVTSMAFIGKRLRLVNVPRLVAFLLPTNRIPAVALGLAAEDRDTYSPPMPRDAGNSRSLLISNLLQRMLLLAENDCDCSLP